MNYFIGGQPARANNNDRDYKTVDTFHFPDDVDDTLDDYSFNGARRKRDSSTTIGRLFNASKNNQRRTLEDVNDLSYFFNDSSSTTGGFFQTTTTTQIDVFNTIDNATAYNNFSVIDNMTDAYGGDNSTTHDCDFQKHEWLEEKFYLISICGTTIAILGIFGNVSTALVLTRPAMRSPNNLYLTTLAIFDTCLLITAILLYSVEYIFEYTDNLNLYTTWLSYVPIVYALSHIAQTGSVYVTVAVTFERYIAVVYPDRSKIFCTQKGAGSAIFWVFCFSILFNCTKFFELEVSEIENCTGFAAYSLEPSFLQTNDLYMTVYSLWITQITMVFAPFLVLFVFNTVIAVTIRKSFKRLRWVQHGPKRNELKEKSREATYVLIVIVLIFLICNSPGFVISLMERIYGAMYLATEMRDFYTFCRETVNFLTIVNSSINFVIYCIFGKDFRKELVHIYGCHGGLTIFVPTEDKFTARNFTYRYSYADAESATNPRNSVLLNVHRDSSSSLFSFSRIIFWFRRRFSSNVVAHQDANGTAASLALADLNSVVYTNKNTMTDDSTNHVGNGYVQYDVHEKYNCYECPVAATMSSSSDSKPECSLTHNPLSLFTPTVVVSSVSPVSRRSSRNSSPSVTIFYSDENVTWL